MVLAGLGRLSGGNSKAESRTSGQDSPGQRFDNAEDLTTLSCGDVEVHMLDKVGYRGNGTFYKAEVGSEVRTLKIFKDPEDCESLKDAISREIEIGKSLMDRCRGNLFPIISGEFSHLNHRILILQPLYGNIFERFQLKPASVDALRIIMFQLMLALEALERMGIVHLNVRTQNIMCVSEIRNNYRIKLFNFNCAQYSSKLTKESEVLSEKEARAPEVILKYAKPSIATDIFGAAMALQKLYFNRTPWFAPCPSLIEEVNDNSILQGLVAMIGPLPADLLGDRPEVATHFVKRNDHWHMKKLVALKTGTKLRDARMNHDEFNTKLEATEEARFIVCCESMLSYVNRPGPSRVLQDAFLKPRLLPKEGNYLADLTRLAKFLNKTTGKCNATP